MATASLLTACSAGDELTDGQASNTIAGYNKADLTPVSLDVTAPMKVTTRGSGTVGGIKETENKWNGQTLWLFMTYKSGTGYGYGVKPAEFITADGGVSTDIKLYKNRKMTAPSENTKDEELKNGTGKRLECADNSINYYPMSGQFNFFGYHIDDAASNNGGSDTEPQYEYAATPAGNTITEENAASAYIIRVPFTINGTQDLMVGTTTANDPDETTMEKAGYSSTNAANANYYSAYSARKNIHPILTFKHKLTRFTFQVIAGDKTSAGLAENEGEAVKTCATEITGIGVNSGTKNSLIVADVRTSGTKQDFDQTTWSDAKDLVLQERKQDGTLSTEGITAQKLTWNNTYNTGDTLSVGEALMVEPNKDSYSAYVNIKQWVKTSNTEPETATAGSNKPTGWEKPSEGAADPYAGTWTLVTHRYPFTINLSGNEKMVAGTSYNVRIWIYGLHEVKVYTTTSIEAWKDGGDIEVNDDKK